MKPIFNNLEKDSELKAIFTIYTGGIFLFTKDRVKEIVPENFTDLGRVDLLRLYYSSDEGRGSVHFDIGNFCDLQDILESKYYRAETFGSSPYKIWREPPFFDDETWFPKE